MHGRNLQPGGIIPGYFRRNFYIAALQSDSLKSFVSCLFDAAGDEIFHFAFFRRDDFFRLEGDDFFSEKNKQGQRQKEQNTYDDENGYLAFFSRNKATSIYRVPLFAHWFEDSLMVYKDYAECTSEKEIKFGNPFTPDI